VKPTQWVYNRDEVPIIALVIGIALIVLGVGGYIATGAVAGTALIPAYFGAAMAILGIVGRNAARLKMAMHVAVFVALLGFAGAIPGAVRLITGTAVRPVAATAQAIMAGLMLVFIVLAVKSFIDARRARP
jgi:hypothetical protein